MKYTYGINWHSLAVRYKEYCRDFNNFNTKQSYIGLLFGYGHPIGSIENIMYTLHLLKRGRINEYLRKILHVHGNS